MKYWLGIATSHVLALVCCSRSKNKYTQHQTAVFSITGHSLDTGIVTASAAGLVGKQGQEVPHGGVRFVVPHDRPIAGVECLQSTEGEVRLPFTGALIMPMSSESLAKHEQIIAKTMNLT